MIRSDELYHYGMPRRSGRYPYGSGERPFQREINRQEYHNALKGKERSIAFDKERTIKKGSNVYRTTSDQNENISGPTYVTYLDTDRDLYRGGYIKDRDSSSKVYEKEMVLLEDLRIPSKEHVKDIISKVATKNKKLIDEAVKSYLDILIPEGSWDRIEFSYDGLTGEQSKAVWDRYVKTVLEQVKNKPLNESYMLFTVSLGKADKLKKAVINELEKEGYNAMTDEAGVRGLGMAEGIDPLIIFNADKMMKTEKISEVSKFEEKTAKRKYSNWRSKAQESNSKGKW